MDVRLLSGLVALGFAICAFLFDRLAARMRDQFLQALALTLWLLALAQGISAALSLPPEQAWLVYVLRLIAFVALIGAILRATLAR